MSEMHKGRDDPSGVLLLSVGDRWRALVAGGESSTVEVLQISCSDPSDRGQLTRITFQSEVFLFYNSRIQYASLLKLLKMFPGAMITSAQAMHLVSLL